MACHNAAVANAPLPRYGPLDFLMWGVVGLMVIWVASGDYGLGAWTVLLGGAWFLLGVLLILRRAWRLPGRGPRPRTLLVAGLALLLAAAAITVALMWRHAGGYQWPDSTAAPGDGRARVFDTDHARPLLLWGLESEGEPACTAVDAEGDRITLRPSEDRFVRPGKIADYVALYELTPRSGNAATVSCVGGDSHHVELRPQVPPAMAALGDAARLPLWLAILGVSLLVGARAGRRWSRPAAATDEFARTQPV